MTRKYAWKRAGKPTCIAQHVAIFHFHALLKSRNVNAIKSALLKFYGQVSAEMQTWAMATSFHHAGYGDFNSWCGRVLSQGITRLKFIFQTSAAIGNKVKATDVH